MKHSTSKTRLMELAGLREVDPIGDIRKSISLVKLTQQNWEKMTPDQQGNALLSVMDDTDEAESYIGADWSDLPNQATANMMIFIKAGGTSSVNEEEYSTMTLKSDIDQKWKTADDMAGDMQQWLTSIYSRGYTPSQGPAVYDKVMNVLSNLVDNFDPQENEL